MTQLSELGVIVILFTAGMGTDLRELRSAGKAGFLVALCGVLVPMVMGTGFGWLAGKMGWLPGNSFLENIFLGTVLTATSVSITVETLKELGHLDTKVGSTILAAALIDDVLGLVALTVVSVFAFVFCLLLAYCAEEFFGVADIIGALVAGLVVVCTPKADYIRSKFEPLSCLLLTPVFFAGIGINVKLPQLNGTLVVFSLLLLAVAIMSKIIGCGLGARLCGVLMRKNVSR